ncbi:MAG: transposase [Candidatus Aminicenantes bacterium]|nr:transposase [Candidatus Aminicenantes bacterium]
MNFMYFFFQPCYCFQMSFDFERRSRRSIRLKGFDYSSPGKYYITICTLNRECLFGDICKGKMILSTAGKIVHHEWLRTSMVRPGIELDAFVIMPNHLHGIISIRLRRGVPLERPVDVGDENRATRQVAPTLKPSTIGAILGQFKSNSTKEIRESVYPGFYWQRNYYEHIIRNGSELSQIRKYILENPANWNEDHDNPVNF